MKCELLLIIEYFAIFNSQNVILNVSDIFLFIFHAVHYESRKETLKKPIYNIFYLQVQIDSDARFSSHILFVS